MLARTRYFVIASLLVLLVGLGAGLVAYYQGLPGALTGHPGPDELRMLPRSAVVVAYANVQDVMSSEVRRRLLAVVPNQGQGQQQLEAATGINVERDIDRVVAGLVPSEGGTGTHATALVLARGRFDQVKIEALMRDAGATVEQYKDRRMILAPKGPNLSVAFIEPGLVAVGSAALVRSAVDLQSGGDSVLANTELMERVKLMDAGNAWAVGRFDALASRANLPPNLAGQLPPITWLAFSGEVNGGIRATVRADTRDEASATSLRDVIRGFVALAKLQASSHPQALTLTNSVELGGTGTNVVLSFDLPAELFDTLLPPSANRQ